jgi:serine/threonine-protein kinase RsbW
VSSQVRLRMPARAEYLLLGRLALAGLARTVPLDPELLADLKLAVTEACANAVRHAYEAEGTMTLRFSVDERLVRIDVEDEGGGFEAQQVDDWEPNALSEDGMGLAIIRAVVDDLEIRSGPGGRGTRLTLTKRL